MIVVPGGGRFADDVRSMDAAIGLSRDAAHWMAIDAMDRHAALIAATPGFVRVVDRAAIVRPSQKFHTSDAAAIDR